VEVLFSTVVISLEQLPKIILLASRYSMRSLHCIRTVAAYSDCFVDCCRKFLQWFWWFL